MRLRSAAKKLLASNMSSRIRRTGSGYSSAPWAWLGGVDKFEPVSGGGNMRHAEEAVGKLVVAGSDRAIHLELSEHALDAVALVVERAVMFDFHAAVWSTRDASLALAHGKVGADCVGVVALVGEQSIGCAFGQADQDVISSAICRLGNRQMEGERSSEGISQAVKLTGEPAPRAAKSASMVPPLPPAAETWARTVVLSML